MRWVWKEDSGQVRRLRGTGTDLRQIPVTGKGGRRHSLTETPLSFAKKLKSLLVIEKKNARDKAHIDYCSTESQRIAVNGVVAKIICALKITCVSQNGCYLVLNLAVFYCPIILVCPLFHIKATMACKIRPCHADIDVELASGVI